VAKFNRPADTPQSLRDLQQQIKEEAERWREHPLVRRDQERLRQLAEVLRRAPPLPAPTAKPKRRRAGGRPPSLTDEEIARLRAAYRAAEPAVRKRERKQIDVFESDLRPLLPKKKRGISNTTLRNCIVRSRRET
jgi:hypothetical protein